MLQYEKTEPKKTKQIDVITKKDTDFEEGALRWISVGGQGAVTANKILAGAMSASGMETKSCYATTFFDKRESVREYLELQRRFRGISEEEIEAIERQAEQNLRRMTYLDKKDILGPGETRYSSPFGNKNYKV